MDIVLENIIVGKVDTNANWTADTTVHPLGFFMISSDAYYNGTTVKKWKIANGVDTWSNIDFVPVAETLAQILLNGNTTNEQSIVSNNGNCSVRIFDTYGQLEFSGNRKGSNLFFDDNEIYNFWRNSISNIEGKALINTINTKLEHTNLIEFTAPSVTKNGYEIATQNFVDQRVQSNIKIIGDWDATSGSYPKADESNTTPFISQWGSTIKQGWAFRVGYGQAGTVDGFYYENGDVVYALVDSPIDDSSNWGDLDHNLQQATESTRGTAKITTTAIIEDETTLDNERIITPYKFWSKAIPKFKLLANTWNLLQTFTNGVKSTLFTNDDGEFKFTKTVAGTILMWTNGQNFRFSATVGGAPSIELDKTTGKLKMLDETASKLVELDSNKGISSISVSKDSIIKDSFDITFDGQGGVLTVNAKAMKRALAVAGTVTGFSIESDVSGSVEIDMKKNGISMIGAGNKIDLVSQSSDTGSPTSWTTDSFAIDDKIELSITSATTITKVWLTIKYNKTS